MFLVRTLFAFGQSLWSGVMTLPLAIALFPTGRFMSPRWRWVGVTLLAGSAIIMLTMQIFMILERPGLDAFRAAQDPMFDIPAYAAAFAVAGVCAAIGFVGALLSLLARARRSRGVERQQIKWFAVFGSMGLLMLLMPTVFWALNLQAVGKALDAHPWITDSLTSLSLIGMIAAIGIAIVRHRLFDIDVLIRKTLQWTLVTLLLGAVYVACVLGLQEAFKRLTGQTSEVAVALSTLALAVAFMPIRRAVQNLIDQRFYRRRYNAEQVIEAYAASIKDEVDTAVIHQKMLGVLADTLQSKKIVLYLAQPNPHPGPLPRRERE